MEEKNKACFNSIIRVLQLFTDGKSHQRSEIVEKTKLSQEEIQEILSGFLGNEIKQIPNSNEFYATPLLHNTLRDLKVMQSKLVEKLKKQRATTKRTLTEEEFKEATKYMSTEDLSQILGLTIKHDNVNKLITFLCMLSSYTEESQFNISYRAPSSTGKSYIPIEIASYFPSEDIIMIAGASPTSFFHESGSWDEEKKAITVGLEKKILIFLDQPHDQLLQKLRPLLSHDKKELIYKITDKKEKRGLRTKTVILRGYPSVIFCTGSLKLDEQESTRNIILSPETTQEKIRESLYLKALKKANPLAFSEFLKTKPERESLKNRILLIKEAKIKFIIIRDYEKLVKRFASNCSKLKPRHTRDLERLISIIQGLALLNLWHRKKDSENNLYVDDVDIENGIKIYNEIAKCQELGIPPYIFCLFEEVIKPLYFEFNKDTIINLNEKNNNLAGLTRKQIITKHYDVYGRAIQDWFLRQQILPSLESAGLIIQEQDPYDKRKTLIHIPTPLLNSLYLTPHPNSISKTIVS